ncbi:MAG: glycosyltransferase [Paludibacteraceae bacterium]|nr:glycosyltransferase [Paludibacteraceae bacterium]
MNTPLVSVIVPVYKAEKFLHKCVDSLLAQTMTDFEVLLIDDGSPDRSGAICDEYAAKDSRIRVFHKANGGVSSARNLGLDNAQGEWIAFVDSDDWVEVDYLLELTRKLDVDLILTGVIFTSGLKIKVESEYYSSKEIDKCFNKYSDTSVLTAPWAKLYRKSLIQKHVIRFDDKIRCGEDFIFVCQFLLFCESIRVFEYIGYNYYNAGEQNISFSKRYNLSIEELEYAINKIKFLNSKLTNRNIEIGEKDIKKKFISLYNLNFKNLDCNVDIYYEFCLKNIGNLTWRQFLSDDIISPIVKCISEIVYLYRKKDYIFARFAYVQLMKFSRNNKDISFKSKKIQLLFLLLRTNSWVLWNLLFKIYVLNLKK